jgi:hypothetical protein
LRDASERQRLALKGARAGRAAAWGEFLSLSEKKSPRGSVPPARDDFYSLCGQKSSRGSISWDRIARGAGAAEPPTLCAALNARRWDRPPTLFAALNARRWDRPPTLCAAVNARRWDRPRT